jgi:peptidylprolyl isomerase
MQAQQIDDPLFRVFHVVKTQDVYMFAPPTDNNNNNNNNSSNAPPSLTKRELFESRGYVNSMAYVCFLIKILFSTTCECGDKCSSLDYLRLIVSNLVPETCGGRKEWICGMELNSLNLLQAYTVTHVRITSKKMMPDVFMFNTDAPKSVFFAISKFGLNLNYLQDLVRFFMKETKKIDPAFMIPYLNLIPVEFGGTPDWVLPPESIATVSSSQETLPETTTTTTTMTSVSSKKQKRDPKDVHVRPPQQLLPHLQRVAELDQEFVPSPGTPPNPKVFLTFQFGNQVADRGRIECELYAHVVPQTAANFISLCKGDEVLTYKDTSFTRIHTGSFCQCGDVTQRNGLGGHLVHGGLINNESFKGGRHTKYVLSMGSHYPNQHNSQFMICTGNTAPWLDGKHAVFGKVISGFDVVDRIDNCGSAGLGNPTLKITIVDCGEIL